jgi:hypothetical protein
MTMSTNWLSALVASAVMSAVFGIGAAVAHADEGDQAMQGPPTKPPLRTGWTAGLAVGLGEVHVVPDEGENPATDEGIGFSVRVGGALTQSFLLMAITEFVEGAASTNTLIGAAAQVYFSERFFLRFGGGYTRLSLGSADPTTGATSTMSFNGFGGLAGVGGEWLQLQDLGLTAELMFMGNRPTEEGIDTTIINGSFLVGIQWF